MQLKSIFAKPVDRAIEGVIKADDEASLRLELEEYVLTNEVEKRLESFLEAYNTYQNANGVWVSGFFGSGKSHLLKMLARILENQEIEGTPAIDYFLTKCGDNEILRGALQKAVSIPSKSILFNIDQKADVISKEQFDALLEVFMKVFDEMRGYYGKQGYIARFERDLDAHGYYEDFKQVYQEIAGSSWERGREQALFENENIAVAYGRVTGKSEFSAMDILDKYREQYRVSIEDFAEEVKTYIDQQSADFRLNFFVDEVGQYIAEHTKLMTNLQTIAESLATKCEGRAWIIVTAQEDMDTVIGDMNQQKSNDFTKIQARFKNRMKLTSQDVAEVIQKRLLAKNQEGIKPLSTLYQQQANNFKTLFDFSDKSASYRNFKDEDHFINSYPFIPYQFSLFQSAIQTLSVHNAFEGKHSSVGERSMLGVFQEVAKKISNSAIGQLATFDLMFDGIRSTLKSNIQTSILQAENNLDNPFAIRLLKILFLVKYIKEFKPTVRNLRVLLLEQFDQDITELEKRVQEALNLLEQQTYIQRHGDLYEYLTNEEQDVEQEIKNTEVDYPAIYKQLEKLIFDNIIKTKKIRYSENHRDYPYTRKIDNQLFGREQELTLHVITPLNDDHANEEQLKMQSAGQDELLVVIPADERLLGDLFMYEKAEKYIRQNYSQTHKDTIKRILDSKHYQNQQRHQELQERIRRLLSQSKLFINSTEIELSSQEAQSRIIVGFQELITRVYSNLQMLRGVNYTEDQIEQYVSYSQEGLFGNDVTQLDEAEQEIFSFIQRNNRSGMRTKLKSLIEKFERKPYGWDNPAICCNLAKLCARGKVEVRSDGNLLEGEELEQALRNSSNYHNILLDPQIEFTSSQVRNLKEFYGEFFDQPAGNGDAKAIGQATGKAFQELKEELEQLKSLASKYPFHTCLNEALEKIQEVSKKPYTWYLTELLEQEEEFFDLKENVIDPIRQFMNGTQKEIFDRASQFLHDQDSNFAYINNDEPSRIQAILADTQCYKGNKMQQLKGLLDTLEKNLSEQIEAEIKTAQETIEALKNKLEKIEDFSKLSPEQQQELIQPFEQFNQSIAQQKLIAVIRDNKRNFEETKYSALLSKMSVWVQPEPSSISAKGSGSKYNVEQRFIPQKAVKVEFDKLWLENETDLDQYLKAMREAMLTEIQNGKRIQL